MVNLKGNKPTIFLIIFLIILIIIILSNYNPQKSGFLGSVVSNEPSSLQLYQTYFEGMGYYCETKEDDMICTKTPSDGISSWGVSYTSSCSFLTNDLSLIMGRNNIDIYEPTGEFSYGFCSDNNNFVIQYYGNNFVSEFESYYSNFYSEQSNDDNGGSDSSNSFIKWLGEHPFPTDDGGTGSMWISGMVFVNFGFWLILLLLFFKMVFGKK